MLVRHKKGFGTLVKILDAVNPVMVLLSIIGLFLEYTSLRGWVAVPNQFISVIFALDFLLRLIAYPAGQYFFKGYGWVDFLASIPGFMVFLGGTPLMAVFKVVRIGRFFRIIRVLRFLRAFDFMKRMRSDSAWIQERVMQTGVAIVLIFVGGIVAVDTAVSNQFENINRQQVEQAWQSANRDTGRLAATYTGALVYFQRGRIYRAADHQLLDLTDYRQLLQRQNESTQLVALSLTTINPDKQTSYPEDGLLIATYQTTAWYNTIMLSLFATLLLILCAIIFYMGFVFAKDMSVIQLIIDSFDAEDYVLLSHEADKYRDAEGRIEINPDEDEISSLMKLAARLGSQLEASGGGGSVSFGANSENLFPGLVGMAGVSGASASELDKQDSRLVEHLEARIGKLEEQMRASQKAVAIKTVKLAIPIITRFVKAELRKPDRT